MKSSSLKCISLKIPETLTNSSSFQGFTTEYPGMKLICGSVPESPVFNHKERVVYFHLSEGMTKLNTEISIRVAPNTGDTGNWKDISGFCKITHLLDPVRWIQGKYEVGRVGPVWSEEYWGSTAWQKLQDPMNQAYVEALAAFCLGKLREEDLSPHFHHFYGAYFCIGDKYHYNITDSFLSFRNCRWFWDGQEKNIFTLQVDEDLPEEVRQNIFQKPEDLPLEDKSETSEATVEELEEDQCSIHADSLHSASEGSFVSEEEEEEGEDNSDENEEESDDDSDDEEIDIFSEINKFPVMLLFTESSQKTMDDLLDDYDLVGSKPGVRLWEEKWTAWIFQIIAALTAAQAVAGFIHNDLHTNNIVWSPTEDDYIWYSTRDGTHFKVPTYGKIFRIIDFGRAMFKVGNQLFFSDDFRPGNDAAEQYNFGEILDEKEPVVEPNPSFDLSRFTVSVFESLFPVSPPVKKRGAVLSEEPGLRVQETESPLYNLLWSWLICDDGHNVLMNPDGGERYPDFDLYKVIAAEVHDAIPSDQVRKPIFEKFRVKKGQVPKKQKIYSLFS
jgi:hypothetical protein